MELPPWLAERLRAPEEHVRLEAHVEPLIAHVRSRSSYAGAALRGEIDRILTAQEGCRNDTLNAAAYSLGRQVGQGLIAERLAHDALLAAGTAIGLPSGECEATVQSGLRAGLLAIRGIRA
jgi:hypothetical protein